MGHSYKVTSPSLIQKKAWNFLAGESASHGLKPLGADRRGPWQGDDRRGRFCLCTGLVGELVSDLSCLLVILSGDSFGKAFAEAALGIKSIS